MLDEREHQHRDEDEGRRDDEGPASGHCGRRFRSRERVALQ
jgi:hypothetical protein